MGKTIRLTASDGHELSAYRAEPAGKPKGGLVVAMEIFGVNSHIRAVADGYAADGYLAIAPALFDRVQRDYETGYTQPEIENGIGVIQKINLDDTMKDVSAALQNVASAGKVGIVGFCWGGTVAWKAACQRPRPGLRRALLRRRSSEPDRTESRSVRCCSTGARPITPSRWRRRRSLPPRTRIETHYFYAAGHGFNCDQRGSYHADSAKLARSRTLEFLAKHVG